MLVYNTKICNEIFWKFFENSSIFVSIIVPYLERYLAASLLCARSIEMLLYEIQFQGLSVHKLLMNTYNVREGWSFTKPGEGSPGVWFQWGFGKRPYTLSSLFLCTVPKYSRILLFEQLQKCKSRLMTFPHKPSWERGTLKLAR